MTILLCLFSYAGPAYKENHEDIDDCLTTTLNYCAASALCNLQSASNIFYACSLVFTQMCLYLLFLNMRKFVMFIMKYCTNIFYQKVTNYFRRYESKFFQRHQTHGASVGLFRVHRCSKTFSKASEWKENSKFNYFEFGRCRTRPFLCYKGGPLQLVRCSSSDSMHSNCPTDNKLPPPKLTHLTTDGDAHMVDVSHKIPTHRQASASALVSLGENVYPLVVQDGEVNKHLKTIIQIAGISGAKKTSDLIPLCHNIPISKVKIEVRVIEGFKLELISTVKTAGSTGVEMEALTAVTVAALTVYDMCKAASHAIEITDVKLLAKSGGKSDFTHKTK